MNEYLEIFPNEAAELGAEEFLGFKAKIPDNAREIERSIVC